MKVIKKAFGNRPDGKETYLFKITNDMGASVELIEYGAAIRGISVPDRDGRMDDVVLGKDSLEEYTAVGAFNGSVTGRIANRVSGNGFSIGERTFTLEKGRERDVTLHCESANYATRFFDGSITKEEADSAEVTFFLRDNGEGGLEVPLDLWVSYFFDNENKLTITYRDIPEEDTAVAITNHCYFNVGGHGLGHISDQILQIASDFYTLMIDADTVSGQVLSVEGTPYDFREPVEIGSYEGPDEGGYDTNFVLRGSGYRLVSTLYDPKSGRVMETYTDLPGIQVYTGGNLLFKFPGKRGAEYVSSGFICLETQHFPDAVNVSHFPSPVQKAGKEYITRTSYHFKVR